VRLLQQTMIKEEKAILAGNASLVLAQPTAPTLAATGSGATLPALTYSVIVAALTLEGYLANGGASATQLITTKSITGADGNSYSLNGGVSKKSANTTQAVTLGQILSATTPVVNGAVAYAWFVGAAGAETLQCITSINSATFSAPLSSGNMAATSLSTSVDYSANSGMAFDGFITSAFLPSNSAYVVSQATGTAGVGTPLTSGGRGNVVEIDTMLRTMWENFRLGVTVIYCNSQELTNITNKVMTTASGTLLRYNSDNGSGSDPYKINANGVVTNYYNPYLPGGGRMIPIVIHPNLPAGTMLVIAKICRCTTKTTTFKTLQKCICAAITTSWIGLCVHASTKWAFMRKAYWLTTSPRPWQLSPTLPTVNDFKPCFGGAFLFLE
jgi:hypothetical protein